MVRWRRLNYNLIPVRVDIGRSVSVGLLLVFVAAFLGCASTAKPVETEANFIGFITEIHPNGKDVLGQIFVESHADKIVSRYIITITKETSIFQQDGNSLRQVDFEALKDKQWVKIWFTGPGIESFPVQGTAGQVVIEE